MSKLDFMHNLGLGDLNAGVSSGNEWLKGTGPLTESKTPVDGSVIAQIQNASLEDYEKVMAGAQMPSGNGARFQLLSVVKLCVKLVILYAKRRTIWAN